MQIVKKAKEFCEDSLKKLEEEKKMSANKENKEEEVKEVKEEEEPPKPEKEKEKPKEEEEEPKSKGIIATNISKNKKVILYYIGVFIVNVVVRGSNLLSLIIPDSPAGGFVSGIATDGVLLITFLAPWIFGGKEALDEEKKETKRIKVERTGIGKELARVNVLNEGLRTKNELQATLMEQNGMKPFRYNPPSDIGYGCEVKPE